MRGSLAELAPPGKPLTLSLAAAVAAYYGPEAFLNPQEHAFVLDAIEKAGTVLPLVPATATGRDDRSPVERRTFRLGDSVRVFTDYEVLRDLLQAGELGKETSSAFVLAEQREEADLLFLVSHVKNFFSLPSHQRINQFPFEGGLVRKVTS